MYEIKIKTEYIISTVSIENKNRINQIQYTWMVLTILKAHTFINRFNHIETNQPVKIMDVNDVLIPFEGNINTGDPMGSNFIFE